MFFEMNLGGGGIDLANSETVVKTPTSSFTTINVTLQRPPKCVIGFLLYRGSTSNKMVYIYDVDANVIYRYYEGTKGTIPPDDASNQVFKYENGSIYVKAGSENYRQSTQYVIIY